MTAYKTRIGCDKLSTVEGNIVMAFTEPGGESTNRLSVILNRSYKVFSTLFLFEFEVSTIYRMRGRGTIMKPWQCFQTRLSGVVYRSVITLPGLIRFGKYWPCELPEGLLTPISPNHCLISAEDNFECTTNFSSLKGQPDHSTRKTIFSTSDGVARRLSVSYCTRCCI